MRNITEYNFIDSRDYVLLPIYFVGLIFIALILGRSNKALNKKIFIISFALKLIFAIIFSLVYQYYYKGGDTSYYFVTGTNLNLESKDFGVWLRMVFMPFDSLEKYRELFSTIPIPFLYIDANYFPGRIVAFLNVFTFNTYINTSMLFSSLSFIGIWRNFLIFERLYPTLRKYFVFSFLLLPSILFWASGISKDTISYGAVSLFTSYFLQIYFLKEHNFKNILMLVFSALIVFAIKPYILLSFLPLALVWVFIKYTKTISNRLSINGSTVLKITTIVTILVIILNKSLIERVVVDTFLNDLFSQIIQMNVYLQGFESASNYDLGLTNLDNLNISIPHFISKLPICWVTTLFRPYIFEAKNPFMLISSLEGIAVMLLTIYALFKSGFSSFLQVVFKNPIVIIIFSYTVIFAFFIGLTSSNFGTLVRYKIPCFSYYLAILFIIIFEAKKIKNNN